MTSHSNSSRRKAFSVFAGELRESYFMAMSALKEHKLRSALTLVGILVGVFSIIVVMTTIQALQEAIQSDVEQLGGQTFMVDKHPVMIFESPENRDRYRRRQNLTLAQGEELAKRATLPRHIGFTRGVGSGEMTSRFSKSAPRVVVTSESPGGFPAQNWNIAEGRGLTDADLDNARDVCVLGSSLAKLLFPEVSPINEQVKYDGFSYTVIGVLEPRRSAMGENSDNFAVIPITTGLNRYGNFRMTIGILVQAPSATAYDATVEQVQGILRVLRKVPPGAENDFEIRSNDSTMEKINDFTFKVRIGVILVSSVALLAAGIGIMNIMLVSVTERTREIGVRRAIGAKKRNIMTQFIMEAIMLCQVGGALGVIFGVTGGNIVAHYIELPAVVPVTSILLGLGICSLVGIIFGTYPAYKAANLDPIESLRYE